MDGQMSGFWFNFLETKISVMQFGESKKKKKQVKGAIKEVHSGVFVDF